MMADLQFGLLGAGTMGANHARVIAEHGGTHLRTVVDADLARARRLAGQHGAIAAQDVDALRGCDAVVIASSTETHVPLALQLLGLGMPLLIEKPISTSLAEVRLVCDEAVQARLVLCCGFVERFNPVIQATRQFLDSEPFHTIALRHSPSVPRMATSVIYDLLIHDIDLAVQLHKTAEIERVGASSWPRGDADGEAVDCTVQFRSGAIATMSASRVSQRKIRSMQIFTEALLLDLDLLRSDLTVYRNVRQDQPDPLTYRAETVIDIPFIRHAGEPLALQLDHFLNLLDGRLDPNEEIRAIVTPHELAVAVASQLTAPEGASYSASS